MHILYKMMRENTAVCSWTSFVPSPLKTRWVIIWSSSIQRDVLAFIICFSPFVHHYNTTIPSTNSELNLRFASNPLRLHDAHVGITHNNMTACLWFLMQSMHMTAPHAARCHLVAPHVSSPTSFLDALHRYDAFTPIATTQ